MKYILIFLSILSVSSQLSADPQYRSENLLGVWHLKDFNDSGYSFSQIAYLPDGKKCEISMDFGLNGGVNINLYINSWYIENGALISSIEKTSVPYIKEGTIINDAIQKLTQSELIVLMEQTSDYAPELERHQKIEGEDPNLICTIVENNLSKISSKAE